MQNGTLYVVATPLGNLEDMTYRAVNVLKYVDLILAEDTRTSGKLLSYYAIDTPTIAFHEHNETTKTDWILEKLQSGQDIALISDAGTPLISDPGYPLVRKLIEQNVQVTPIPGASAAIAALSASGLASDQFQFLGFLPVKTNARIKALNTIKDYPGTTIVYESVHRITKLIHDATEVLGEPHMVTVARELTKKFEQIYTDTLGNVQQYLQNHPEKIKGEFVILFAKTANQKELMTDNVDTDRMLTVLLAKMPLKEAVKVTCDITGQRKNEVYQRALKSGSK